MKKIFLALAMFLSVSCFAQVSNFKQTSSNSTGTITNSGADTMNLQLSRGYAYMAVQPVFTKTSGTMAGTATLYQSIDGVNYITTGSTFSLVDGAVTQTVWSVQKPCRYLRIITTGGTTMVVTCKAYFISGQ